MKEGNKGIYWPRIIFSYGLFLALGMNVAATGPLLNEFSGMTGSGLKQVSWVFVVRSMGGLLSSLLGVHLYDIKDVKKILAIVLSLLAVALILIPFAGNLVLLLALFFLAGFSHNMSDASGNLTVASSYKGNSGPAISFLHFTFGIGSLALPLFMNLFHKTGVPQVRVYWIIAGIIILGVVLNLFLKNPEISQKRKKEVKDRPRILFLILLPLFFFFYTGTEFSLSGWIYNFSVESGLFNETNAAFLTSLFFGIYTGSRLLMVPVTARVKPEKILVFSMSMAFGVLVLFAVLPLSSWLIAGGIALLGLFLAPIYPVFLSMMQQRFGLTGKLASFIMSGAVVGGMVFPWLIGQFFESLGPFIMIYSLCATSFTDLILLILLVKIKPGKPKRGFLKKDTLVG